MTGEKIEISVAGMVAGYEVTLQTQTSADNVADSIQELIKVLKSQGATQVKFEEKGVPPADSDMPLQRLAGELDIDAATLKNYVGFKDRTVQLRKASQIMLADALTMLIFSVEKGLQESSLSLNEFENLISMNGIKFEYPTTTAIFNLKNVGYLNAKLYDEEKKLSLAPKGEDNARKAFGALIQGVSPKRKVRKRKKSR
jgi:hypothetical protein